MLPGDLFLDDGTWLVVDAGDSAVDTDAAADASSDGPLLGSVSDFIVAAAAGGVIGNYTYDTLRAMAAQVTGAEAPGVLAASAPEDVVDAVRRFCVRMGYGSIVITEVVGDAQSGWGIRGTADGEELIARADPSGTVTHIRVR